MAVHWCFHHHRSHSERSTSENMKIMGNCIIKTHFNLKQSLKSFINDWRLCVLLITVFFPISGNLCRAAAGDGTTYSLAEENIDFRIIFALFCTVLAFMVSSRKKTETDGREDGSINGWMGAKELMYEICF